MIRYIFIPGLLGFRYAFFPPEVDSRNAKVYTSIPSHDSVQIGIFRLFIMFHLPNIDMILMLLLSGRLLYLLPLQ